jgi:hypothetical protein
MGRLVRVPKRANADLPIAGLEDVLPSGMGGVDGQMQQALAGDNYLERIVKYIPFEVIAFSIFINAILEQAAKTGGKGASMAGVPVLTVAQGALMVGLVLVPLFVWYVREAGDAWFTNALVSTLVFPFWAYAIGAVAFNDYWDGNLAAILLATITVVSGLVAPRAPKLRRQERKANNVPTRPDRPHLDLVEPSPA